MAGKVEVRIRYKKKPDGIVTGRYCNKLEVTRDSC